MELSELMVIREEQESLFETLRKIKSSLDHELTQLTNNVRMMAHSENRIQQASKDITNIKTEIKENLDSVKITLKGSRRSRAKRILLIEETQKRLARKNLNPFTETIPAEYENLKKLKLEIAILQTELEKIFDNKVKP